MPVVPARCPRPRDAAGPGDMSLAWWLCSERDGKTMSPLSSAPLMGRGPSPSTTLRVKKRLRAPVIGQSGHDPQATATGRTPLMSAANTRAARPLTPSDGRRAERSSQGRIFLHQNDNRLARSNQASRYVPAVCQEGINRLEYAQASPASDSRRPEHRMTRSYRRKTRR